MKTHKRSSSFPWKQSAALTLCLMAAATGLWAQSAGILTQSFFYFPRFVSGPGFDSGLAIFNPAKLDATVNVALIDGKGVSGNPVAVTVPALGRTAVTASQLFGASNPDASLQVISAAEGIYATYAAFDSAGSYTDGTGTARSALQLIFPVAPGASTPSMEIVLRNATTKNAAVQLKLWGLDGADLGSAVVPLPASSSFRGTAGSLFPGGTNYSDASHITATGKPISIFSEAQPFYGTSVFSLAGGPDVAAANALDLTEAVTVGTFPYFRTGGDYFSLVSIANVDSASASVTLSAFRNDGTSAGSRTVTIQGNGGLREAVGTLFPALASGEQQGWILVQSTGRIFAYVLYGRSQGSLSAEPLQKTPQYRLVFPQAVQDSSSSTEISIVNPGPGAGDARVYLVDPAGTTLAAARVPLAAGQRVFYPLPELFQELPDVPGGLIAVIASQPVFASASVWSASGTTVINFPPVQVPAGYAPAPLTEFTVKGKVILNGEPVAGFRVILSGPAGGVAITDEEGKYEFNGLPPGRYSMKVDQYGLAFTPAVTNFEITTFDIYQEFTASTAPGEIVIVPDSIPAGSPDTTARVFGAGFDLTSQAFVDTVRLNTTLLSPNRLEILLPAYQVERATTFDVYVVTGGSTSQPYPIVVYLDRPQLSSVTTVGNIMEGAQGAVLVLQGSGFLPAAKVKINGQSDGIEINLVSDQQIVAKVPASYLITGGIYPVTVENPFPSLNAESNTQLMTVYFPTPAIQNIYPGSLRVQLEDNRLARIDLDGYQFRRGAVVKIDDNPLPTEYCTVIPSCLADHLTAYVPPEYLREARFAKITVENPNPSLAASEVVYLRIDNLQPTITRVVPGSATLLPNVLDLHVMPIVVTGTNIGPQTQWRIYRPLSPPPPFTGYSGGGVILGPTQLYIDWDVSYPESLGDWVIQIMNPWPGGGESQGQQFTITKGNFVENPFLLFMSPTAVPAGAGSFTLTVIGVNFKAESQLYFSTTPLVTTVVSDREIHGEVPAYLVKSAGTRPITVINPDTGGASNRLYLTVN